MSTPIPEFVFVLGIMRRSGTNYLSDLLGHHPDCQKVQRVWEDFFLASADKLQDFIDSVTAYWNPEWDPEQRCRNDLRKKLCDACLGTLVETTRSIIQKPPKYFVSKTPSVQNLALLGDYFSNVRCIVVVRDGRAVVESCMKSFNWDFDNTVEQWAQAARTIIEVQRKSKSFLLVRYEDCLHDLRNEMVRIFADLNLEEQAYDYQKAESLPIRGSSTFGRQNGAVHWGAVEKTSQFRPLERFANWNTEMLSRFNAVAGEENAHFGYSD